jgi:hypothetical protein
MLGAKVSAGDTALFSVIRRITSTDLRTVAYRRALPLMTSILNKRHSKGPL